jgi:hypothetical protein
MITAEGRGGGTKGLGGPALSWIISWTVIHLPSASEVTRAVAGIFLF